MFLGKNRRACPFRLWGSFGFLTLIGFMGWSLHKGCNFDPMAYGGALSAYLLAWGGAVYAKDKASV